MHSVEHMETFLTFSSDSQGLVSAATLESLSGAHAFCDLPLKRGAVT